MATLSKNLNTGSWRTLGGFAPSFAAASDLALASSVLDVFSSWGMGCEVLGGREMLSAGIPGSPEDRPQVKVSHRSNYQNEYGPPIVSSPDALKRIPN